jgi:hypothetical protein
LGEQQKPKEEELTRNIRATLNDKGFGFLSISISNVTDGNISFTSPRQHPDTLTLTNQSSRPGGNKKSRNVNARNTPGVLDKLQIFNWLPGSWKVKYVTQTYHHWLRVNDSLLMCLIIRYRNEDDEPDISVGFSIRYSISDSAILSLRGIEWKFLSANDKEIHFKNETTPKSANVKWSLADDKKSWQSAISGEANLEVVNLIRDENINLENIVTEFIAKHPELIKKT